MTAPPTRAQHDGPVVEAHALVRRYRRGDEVIVALAGVDLTVQPGEFVAVVGPSGGGKTTLLQLLGGLDQPDGGALEVAGVALHAADESARDAFRRAHVGFVLQFFNLIDTASARDNVALGLLARGRGWRRARQEADELLAGLGLAHRADHRPRELSGGEQQRVAIARAIAGDPALLLADEPTGELDSDSGATVIDLLARLRSEHATTVVVATHDPSVAAAADRVVRLHDGRVDDDSDPP